MAKSGAVAYTQNQLAKAVVETVDINLTWAKNHLRDWHNDPDDMWLKERHSRSVKMSDGKMRAGYKVFNYHSEND